MIKKLLITLAASFTFFSAFGSTMNTPPANFWLHFSNVKSNGNLLSDWECKRIFSGPYYIGPDNAFVARNGVAVKLMRSSFRRSVSNGIVIQQGKVLVVSSNPQKLYKTTFYAADVGVMNTNTFSGVFYGNNFCYGNYSSSARR